MSFIIYMPPEVSAALQSYPRPLTNGNSHNSNGGIEAVDHFEEDAAVAEERRRVDNMPLGTDAITLQHLRKVYTGRPQKVTSFC